MSEQNKPLLLRPYTPNVDHSLNEGPFTFAKLLALITVLLYALVYNIICTPLGWIGIIIVASGYKLISK